jgi:hypothetical protein
MRRFWTHWGAVVLEVAAEWRRRRQISLVDMKMPKTRWDCPHPIPRPGDLPVMPVVAIKTTGSLVFSGCCLDHRNDCGTDCVRQKGPHGDDCD